MERVLLRKQIGDEAYVELEGKGLTAEMVNPTVSTRVRSFLRAHVHSRNPLATPVSDTRLLTHIYTLANGVSISTHKRLSHR